MVVVGCAVDVRAAEGGAERRLIEAVLAGEKERFRELVACHERCVNNLLYRQLGDEQTSRELAQDVFLKAYLNLHRFRFQASFRNWLIRIALNTANSYFASRRCRELRLTTALESIEPPSSAPQLIELSADVLRLRKYIAALRPHYRDVVTLCALEDLSYQEAADVLDLPVGTVSSRLSKALNILRRKFNRSQS